MTPDEFKAIVDRFKPIDLYKTDIKHVSFDHFIALSRKKASMLREMGSALETTDHLMELIDLIPLDHLTYITDLERYQLCCSVEKNPDKDAIAYLTLQGFFDQMNDMRLSIDALKPRLDR